MSDTRFVNNLKRRYSEVYRGISSLKKHYRLEEYVVNCYVCRNKKTGEIGYFDSKMAPSSGFLYFYKIG